MRVEVRTRNASYEESDRRRAQRHLDKVARLVSPLATLRLELREESNPSIEERCVADARLQLKGAVLHAEGTSAKDMGAAIEAMVDKLLRQVHRYLAKHRHRNHHTLRERRASQEGYLLPDGLEHQGALVA
jgi:putative sigma-54 modulation protein